MAAGRYSFVIEVGVDFEKTITWLEGGLPVDLTDFTGLLQVRQTPTSPVLLEFSDGDGTIVFGGVLGTIVLTRSAAVTALLSWQSRAYFDLVITGPTPDFTVTRLLEGRVELSPQVSH